MCRVSLGRRAARRLTTLVAIAGWFGMLTSWSEAQGQRMPSAIAPTGQSAHCEDGCPHCQRAPFRLTAYEVANPDPVGRSNGLAVASRPQDSGGASAGAILPNRPIIQLPDGVAPQSNFTAPDEYLFDGGDRPPTAKVGSDWTVLGLDLEDTIGHYDTLGGDRIVSPSNRVRIYAPRFAAVRKITGAESANAIESAAQATVRLPHIEVDADQMSSTTLQNIQPRRNTGVVVVDSIRDRTRGLTVDNTLIPTGFSGVFAAHEDFQIMRTGVMDNAEKARLAIMINAAKSWESALGVQVTTGGQKAMIVRDALVAMEEASTGREGQPKLRVYKVADKAYARPGDTLEFTIRFDNIGSDVMGNVTIIDNLTGRLEFVPDSSQCSLKSEFKTARNVADSQTLRWEITDPLKPGEGGVIRFQCRVR